MIISNVVNLAYYYTGLNFITKIDMLPFLLIKLLEAILNFHSPLWWYRKNIDTFIIDYHYEFRRRQLSIEKNIVNVYNDI